MIPRLIHLIWFGDTVSDVATEAVARWQQLGGGREVVLHRDDRLLLPGFRAAWEQAGGDLPKKSDLLRWSVLLAQGGWYFDCDIRSALRLDQIEEECQPDGRLFITPFRADSHFATIDVLACAPDWPGRAAVLSYVAAPPWGLSHWCYGTQLLSWLSLYHEDQLDIAPDAYCASDPACPFGRRGRQPVTRADDNLNVSLACYPPCNYGDMHL